MSKIENVALLRDFLLKQQKYSKWTERIFNVFIAKAVKNFEDILGRNFFVEKEIDSDTATARLFGERLRDAGYLQQGIAHRKRYDDEPYLFSYIAVGQSGGGSDLFKESSALYKALAESVEREVWKKNEVPVVLKASQKLIESKGYRYLRPESLVGLSKEQRNTAKWLQFDTNTNFSWSVAYSLPGHSKILVPTQLLTAASSRTLRALGEPMLRWPITTGLASETTLEKAILHGTLEVIERDAFMISYLNKLSPPQIDFEEAAKTDDEIATLLSTLHRYKLSLRALSLPTDFPAYVCLSVLTDDTKIGPAVTVGAKASFNFKQALMGSVAETISTRSFARGALMKNKGNNSRKEMDLEDRILYWSNPERTTLLDFLFQGKKINLPTAQQLPNTSDQLRMLTESCASKGYNLIYRKISDSNLERNGLYVVTVIIPELQPLHLNESLPYFSGQRLKDIPSKFGYRVEDELNTVPHPFP